MSAYNDFIYLLGDIFRAIFKILPTLGNLPNYLIALALVFGAIYWLRMQKNFNQEAKDNGTIE